LTNPYNVGANTEKSLIQGWGIAIGPAENTFRNISCKVSLNRSMIIILTRKFYAMDLNVIGKETVEKLLMEDQHEIIKAVESEPSISGVSINASYISDTGILRVFEDKDQFLKIESIFNFEYTEDVT
jgi:hypothetical protein